MMVILFTSVWYAFKIIYSIYAFLFKTVLYMSDSESLSVWWNGYDDMQSEINRFEIALYEDSCGNGDDSLLSDYEPLAWNATEFLYLGLGLQVDSFLHFLQFYNFTKLLL